MIQCLWLKKNCSQHGTAHLLSIIGLAGFGLLSFASCKGYRPAFIPKTASCRIALQVFAPSFRIKSGIGNKTKGHKRFFICLFGLAGFEPATPSSRTMYASRCATARKKTEATGIEPAISGLTGRRDNQLRYASV